MIPMIEFKDFTFCYRTQAEPSVKNINLTIYEGEKILIAGPSGSGKSTLASCINGIIPFNLEGKSTGTLTINGRETKDQSIFELSKVIGTVLQDPDGQFVGLTAGEDIAFSLENNLITQTDMGTRVKGAAALVGMETRLDASPYRLSGGQKQRVSMAGVIVEEVKLLLFDEPLANLDPLAGKKAIELIDDIKKETNTTVVIIEHRIEDVLHRDIDRIILMQDGRIVADVTPEQALSQRLLETTGLREPLYVSALNYSGVNLKNVTGLPRIDQLALTEDQTAQVKTWYEASPVAESEVKAPVVLSLEGVSFAYEADASSFAVRDIGFEVKAGEILSIVGTNGAGKSTTAKIICGFNKITTGKIVAKGQEITGDTIFQRAKTIGYVMQNPNQMICKPMIYDEVALGLVNQGLSPELIEEKVDQALKICGLSPFKKWPISALSFGQKKRVTIASVLVMNPDILILDEPTAGQDYTHYTEIMQFLKELQAMGKTIVLITHDMHLMLEYAQRGIVFSHGEVIADLTTPEILCDVALSEKASLKETSLFHLANLCGIDPVGLTNRLINEEKRNQAHGSN